MVCLSHFENLHVNCYMNTLHSFEVLRNKRECTYFIQDNKTSSTENTKAYNLKHVGLITMQPSTLSLFMFFLAR